jgi:ankyrin repeat protein
MRWKEWQAQWRWMEDIARKREWDVTPLEIASPAMESEVESVEQRYGVAVPNQLRAALTKLSGEVTFGWYVPSHLHSMERNEMPSMSFNRDAVWSLEHIDQMAMPIFLEWKESLASRDLSEAPNRPEMWENQFAFYNLINGDWLTIDTSDPDPAKQPVRYFSHELETLHGLALAPDFFTFIDQMSRLGLAGTEWASWMRFSNGQEKDTFYLDADSAGSKAWIAWLERDPNTIEPDEPPPAVLETSLADRALLDAARANSLAGVNAALLAGARPDCVPADEWLRELAWNEEFSTAITYAARRNNIGMIERLLEAGATLNTRLLPLNTAVKESSLATVRWLIANGARVNGWKQQRYWPLHDLVVTRGDMASMTREEYRERLIRSVSFSNPALFDTLIAEAEDEEVRESYRDARRVMEEQSKKSLEDVDNKLEVHISHEDYMNMLEALLDAGADPDAPWDNDITMLTWGDDATAKVLLAHGASPNIRDIHGRTPLHSARTGGKVRILVAGGADINALAISPDGERGMSYTPLQAALLSRTLDGDSPITALLELGADTTLTDAEGRSTLAYCFNQDAFRLIMAKGGDPLALQPGKQTLLHNLTSYHWLPRQQFPNEVAFLDFLLSLGIDINARDEKGRTMLHYAAEREGYDDAGPHYELVMARGADKHIKDNDGKRPFDLVSKSLKDVRTLLK